MPRELSRMTIESQEIGDHLSTGRGLLSFSMLMGIEAGDAVAVPWIFVECNHKIEAMAAAVAVMMISLGII